LQKLEQEQAAMAAEGAASPSSGRAKSPSLKAPGRKPRRASRNGFQKAFPPPDNVPFPVENTIVEGDVQRFGCKCFVLLRVLEAQCDMDLFREKLREVELRKLEKRKKIQAAKKKIKDKEEAEIARVNKIKQELKGKNYTLDHQGNVIMVKAPRAERMPVLSHAPKIKVEKDANLEESKEKSEVHSSRALFPFGLIHVEMCFFLEEENNFQAQRSYHLQEEEEEKQEERLRHGLHGRLCRIFAARD